MSAKTTPKPSAADLTAAIRDLLSVRYASPAWALFFEVPNSTGWAGDRRCDAVAMSLWPSKGLELHGFEIKVSRADWLRELQDPKKSDAIGKYMDRFWLVLDSPDIVAPGEVPPGWGVLTRRGEKLHGVTEASKLEAEPLSRGFFAALCRCAQGDAEARVKAAHAPSQEQLHAEYKKGEAAGREYVELETKAERERHEHLKAVVRDFEQASGVILSNWRNDGKQIGEAVRAVMALDSRLDDLARRLDASADDFDRWRAVMQERAAAIRAVIQKGETP